MMMSTGPEQFLSALEQLGVSISNRQILVSALASADNWQSTLLQFATMGRKDGVVFSLVTGREHLAKFAELFESVGLNYRDFQTWLANTF
jgi:hypothetical protein